MVKKGETDDTEGLLDEEGNVIALLTKQDVVEQLRASDNDVVDDVVDIALQIVQSWKEAIESPELNEDFDFEKALQMEVDYKNLDKVDGKIRDFPAALHQLNVLGRLISMNLSLEEIHRMNDDMTDRYLKLTREYERLNRAVIRVAAANNISILRTVSRWKNITQNTIRFSFRR